MTRTGETVAVKIQYPAIRNAVANDFKLLRSAAVGGRITGHIPSLVGSRLFELLYFQVLRVRALHADPHPGNYLFSNQSEIGLVDFGCVKEVVPAYGDLLRVLLGDRFSEKEKVDRIAQLIWGETAARKRQGTCRVMQATLEFGRRIFPPPSAGRTVVDFADASLFAGLAQVAKEVLQNKLTRPEWVFIKRAEIGLYNLLHRLGARVNTVALVRRLLGA